ncbi:SPOR domain-containing protein [Marinobacter caseinilyticus]|uniref:SPOR domain-containing protein n=1 Tax=Marinobacter caseinilyticus TaxID=2692195 RepID=UPI001407CD3D|nr:SPOR domain-containing protein [Marinobacter caseinilyticus]
MKSLVVLLVTLNLLLWYSQPTDNGLQDSDAATGRLPRVAALKLVKPDSVAPSPVIPDVVPSDDAVAAPVQAPVSTAASPPAVADSSSDEPEPEAVPVAVPIENPEPAPAMLCVELGWFEDESSAMVAAESLGVTGKVREVRAVERPDQPFHWVIIPPASSREAANERFRSVQKRGIDSYLVTQGDQENAISLGLFESRAAAERVLARRKNQGINATLASFPRNRISYALVFSANFPSGSGSIGEQQAGYEERYESVKFSGCEGVATTEKNP